MIDSNPLPLPPQARRRRRRGPPAGNRNAALAAAMRRADIRQYFLGLTRDNVNFREQLQYLIDSKQVFRPEYGWLLKQVMSYAFGVPAPLEEDLQDMSKALVFLSMNPIGQEQHDPLLRARPIGPREVGPAPDPEPETQGPAHPAGRR